MSQPVTHHLLHEIAKTDPERQVWMSGTSEAGPFLRRGLRNFLRRCELEWHGIVEITWVENSYFFVSQFTFRLEGPARCVKSFFDYLGD